MKRFFGKLNKENTISQGAIILGFFYLLSAILGFLRDRLLASTFGAENRLLDSYYAAFRIPDFVFNIFVLGAISAAFIPVFVNYYSKSQEKEAWKVANVLLNVSMTVLIVVGILISIFARPILSVFTHGFRGDTAMLLGQNVDLISLTVSLTRIMLLSSIFFGISSIAGSIQNSLKRFTSYAAAPVIYNLGIIFGIVFLAPSMGIYGVAWGVVLGSFTQMLLQLVSAYKLGFRHKLTFQIFHPGFIRIVRLMIFRAGALMVEQINLLIEVSVGSTLPAGSIAFFTLANNLERLPATLFGISLATAIFPTLAETATRVKKHTFLLQFFSSIKQILFFIVPISIIFILFRKEITILILGTGEFTATNARITASALGWFSVSLFAQALLPIIIRAFFSLQDTRTPFFVSLCTMVLNFFAAVYFSRYFLGGLGAPGLAIAFSITSIANFMLLLILIRKKIGHVAESKVLHSLSKTIISTLLMVVALKLLIALFGISPDLNKSHIAGYLLVAGSLGGFVYLISSWFLKSEEIHFLKPILMKLKFSK